MVRGSNSVKVQEWTRRLLRFHKSDVTVAQFCQGEGVSQPSFYHWKSKLRDQRLPTESPNRRPASSRNRTNKRPAFKAVQVTSSSQPSASQPALTVCMSGGIQIEVADNPAAIQAVMRELLNAEKVRSGAAAC
jgi:hypothetical protein